MGDSDEQADLLIPAIGAARLLETVPDGEGETIAAIRANLDREVRTRASAAGVARRDEHPKAHGCVRGLFEVLAPPSTDIAVGLFAQPRTYAAWVRFSNASGRPQSDATPDGRGVAIKLMGVEGSRSGTQDIVMMNAPRFFLRDAAQALAFSQAGDNAARFFFPSPSPLHWRLHELFAAMAITQRRMLNPLNVRYWSVTPYLFGDDACKFSLRPAGEPFPFEDRSTPNYLHDNLAKSLRSRDAVFDFLIQRRAKGMSVEDSTIEWKEAAAAFTLAGRLTIPRQELDNSDPLSFGENLSFTPWHGLEAHRPLGAVNRVRREVYQALSAVRHELNGARMVEPTA